MNKSCSLLNLFALSVASTFALATQASELPQSPRERTASAICIYQHADVCNQELEGIMSYECGHLTVNLLEGTFAPQGTCESGKDCRYKYTNKFTCIDPLKPYVSVGRASVWMTEEAAETEMRDHAQSLCPKGLAAEQLTPTDKSMELPNNVAKATFVCH